MSSRFRAAVLLLTSTSVLSGCPKPQVASRTTFRVDTPDARAERGALKPKVDALSKDAEALLHAQDELVWKHWTGGTGADLGKTYAGHEALLSRDSIQRVDRLRALSVDARDLRALTYLKSYLVGEYLARQTAEVSEAIANLEASMSFSAEGHDHPYRELDRLLLSEPSLAKRHALYAASLPSVDRLNESLHRRNEKVTALLRELGYPSNEAFGVELRQADLSALSAAAEEVIHRTSVAYTQLLALRAKTRLQASVLQLQRADLPRLFRAPDVDRFFPKAQLLPRALETLKGMGFDLAALKNIHLDVKDSPRKSSRALTLPVAVPGDIRVSLRLTGGARDQRTLFHELGHALHDGLTSEPRFELAQLGNGTVAEVFAYLFEDLVDDRLWLEQNAGLSGAEREEYLAGANAQRLYLLRRVSGRLLYQVMRERLPEGDPGKGLYALLLKRVDTLPLTPADEARYLVDADELYPAADTFRAALIAVQLEAQLRTRFGVTWWNRKEAGAFLRGLFASGDSLTPDELARAFGDPGLRPEVMVNRLLGSLRFDPTPPPPSAHPPLPLNPPDGGAPAAADAGAP